MPLQQVIVLALVQGLTEFLPISSTAHLVLVPRLLRWPDPGLGFDIALHFGTLIAVITFFLPTWFSLGKSAIRFLLPPNSREVGGEESRQVQRLLIYIILATIPAVISGLVLHRAAERTLRTLPIIGISLITVGVLMWWAERFSNKLKPLHEIAWGDAVSVGLAQALAVVPGVSRSGSTIATGLARGLNMDAATRFSFLISTPVIAGAALVEGRELLVTGLPPEMRVPFLIGTSVSAVVGYMAIWGLIRYLRSRSLMLFVAYRIVVGTLILVAVSAGAL